ncbi:hypothetical protein KQ51_01135 [Candidatus Izimaplasma bacterium HR1]|jgi:uncharacterized protein YneF (UPF0154 family)|uniref:YneF family protein n=1 Tax=Candidatus Izimoplasma sp. HR1 TaxID=1541959 RepID=UPI0004F6C9D5|nr:hypothetical protein KQ51_01135 [Candidatus Izimaplasma bacterium HR1]
MVSLATWAFVLILVGVLLVGGALGFFLSQRYFKKYLRDNPPVNENMIRAMMMQMGRKPSEKQVRQVMQSMNQAK